MLILCPLTVLVQDRLLVPSIRRKIVRHWPEQGKLVHCAFNMLPTCGVGVGVYCTDVLYLLYVPQ